jgi:hypothetical protein
MTLTYIPDNFDFNSYINYKNLGSKSNSQFNTNGNSPFNSGDTMELNNILPNDLAKVMFELDDNIEEMDNEINELNKEGNERTRITYKKNKITLKTHDNFFLNIKYSRFPKEEYDICAINDNIIESVLKLRKIPLELAKGQPLKKDKKKKQKFVYYIKFMNDYYLCINKDMILYASKDKNFIFYFDVCQLTPEEISKLKI